MRGNLHTSFFFVCSGINDEGAQEEAVNVNYALLTAPFYPRNANFCVQFMLGIE